MNKNLLFIGVGGQGTILATKILSLGLASLGYDVKMSEIHGMSQRGGSVTTQLKYGGKIYAPNIGPGEADTIIAFEKSEALRALPYLKKGGTVIMDEREIYPYSVLTGQQPYPANAYDALKKAVGAVHLVKAAKIAEELGNVRAQNIVLLGTLIKILGLQGVDWKSLISANVPPRAAELNLKAFDAGFGAK